MTNFLDLPRADFVDDFQDLVALSLGGRPAEDRTVAIVCAAYIEKYLERLIARYFPLLSSEKDLQSAFFDPVSGMAGSLGRKIQMGRALNAITSDMYNDARQIAKIRNKFAHTLDIHSFNDQRVRDLVDNIIYPSNVRMADGTFQKHPEDWDHNAKFRYSAIAICEQIRQLSVPEWPSEFISGRQIVSFDERPSWHDRLDKPPPLRK